MASNSTAPGLISLDDFPAFLKTQKNLARYSSSTERKPNHLWYQIEKAKIDGLLKQFKEAVVDLLKGSPEDDKELQHLIRNVDKVVNVLRSPPIRVALLGAQGAGKSLFTNAVFDCDGLSLTGADGDACTSSILKYVGYSAAASGGRFIAEVKFLNATKREALLEEHARSYYQYQHADEDSDDDDDEDAPLLKRQKHENDDLKDGRSKDTALDVFTTIFGSRDTFLEHWSATSYRNKEFVRICKLKCEEALQNEGPDGKGIVLKVAQDQRSLMTQIKPFLTKVKDVNCLWPLVDSISIHFGNDLLQAGLEFIDLPGWGDHNLSRARHMDEIKDVVDVVMILTDTIRITSEDKLLSSIRAAVAHHGASKVKIVATKIDDITKNQLSQYTGGIYDEIKQLENMANDQEARLDEEEEVNMQSLMEKDKIGKYKSYLTRATLQAKVMSRMDAITNDFAAKLQSRNTKELPQVFHTSASEYMEWIKSTRVNFKDQPSLPVDMTGIPAIRHFLYTLPATQNLKDYEDHIYNKLPGFLDRIERTVTENDRDGGFISISEDFTKVRKPFMAKQLSDVKARFQAASDASIAILVPDLPSYRENIDDYIKDGWFSLRSQAFNRILSFRGILPKGASKARGLEGGVNWNKHLATLLTNAFQKWSKQYQRLMLPMPESLARVFHALHRKINRVITDAAANVPTVEKARQKWGSLKERILVKLETLMDDIMDTHSEALEWAIMEHERYSSLISDVTDNTYIEVFNSEPALKPPNPKTKKQTKKYVMPKLKYQQEKLSEMLLTSDNHLVEQIINHFQSTFDKRIRHTIDKHFAGIESIFDDFDTKIRAQGPINYRLRPQGEDVRARVKEHMTELQERIDHLKTLLPTRMSQGENEEDGQAYSDDAKEDDDDDFATTYNKVSKRKKTAPPVESRSSKMIKREHF